MCLLKLKVMNRPEEQKTAHELVAEIFGTVDAPK